MSTTLSSLPLSLFYLASGLSSMSSSSNRLFFSMDSRLSSGIFSTMSILSSIMFMFNVEFSLSSSKYCGLSIVQSVFLNDFWFVYSD